MDEFGPGTGVGPGKHLKCGKLGRVLCLIVAALPLCLYPDHDYQHSMLCSFNLSVHFGEAHYLS